MLTVLKCLWLSVNTMKRQIDEMTENVGKTVASELIHSKFSIQLDEPTFGSSAILMAYIRYF